MFLQRKLELVNSIMTWTTNNVIQKILHRGWAVFAADYDIPWSNNKYYLLHVIVGKLKKSLWICYADMIKPLNTYLL